MRSNRNLYRDEKNGKVCGVCAGLAEYLDLPVWQVRTAALLGLFFMGQVVVPAYFIAYFVMDKKPYYKEVTDRFDELDEVEEDNRAEFRAEVKLSRREKRARRKQEAQRKAAEPKMTNAQAFRTVKSKFNNIEDRLRVMERHVTSTQFELQRELNKISGEA